MLGRFGLILAAALAAAAAPAQAATPASGTVSAAQPETTFSAHVTDGGVATDVGYAELGGTQGTCPNPWCDTFHLGVGEVGDAKRLTIQVEASSAGNNVSLEVVHPDGRTTYLTAPVSTGEPVSLSRTAVIEPVVSGEYVLNVHGEPRSGSDLEIDGIARLGDIGAAACAAAREWTYDGGGDPGTTGPVDDPLFTLQPGLQLLKADKAWARGAKGKGVKVAVVDTGIDWNHPDLRGAVMDDGADLIDGLDGDCVIGPKDDAGHGTMVAGLIAARADNGIGVAGVAPLAKILPVRVCTGACDLMTIADGIRWAADRKADVINVSLGFHNLDLNSLNGTHDPYANAAVEAVNYAWEKGSVVVVAAGNGIPLPIAFGAPAGGVGEPLCARPAVAAKSLCVGATDKRGAPANWSNFPNGSETGFRAFGGLTIGISGTAPTLGTCDEGVISTNWPGAGRQPCVTRSYAGSLGTSFAAPQVAGAAAILAGLGLDNTQIVERLKATASGGGSSNPVMGYGIPDLDAATKGLAKRKRAKKRRRLR